MAIKQANTYYCTMQLSKKCKDKKGILTSTDFYTVSDNTFFENGKFHICKNCIKEYVYDGDEVNKDKFKKILMLFNLPYLTREFDSAGVDKNETIGTYMKNIYLNYKGKSWEDSDGLNILDNDDENKFKVTKDMVRIWGRGYTPEDYEWLEETYNEWIIPYKHDTLAEQKTFRYLALKELEIMKGREEGKVVDKLEETYRKFMSDANVVPRDANAANDAENINMLGLWTRDIERYRPAEYFKDKKLYKDFDGIKDYLQRFVFRPLKNLLAGTREFDGEFNVEDENKNSTDGVEENE